MNPALARLDLMLQAFGLPSLDDVIEQAVSAYAREHPFTPARSVFDSEFGHVPLGWLRRRKRMERRWDRANARLIKHPTYHTRRAA